MSGLKKVVAQNIKEARKKAGLKQGELAERCGWGYSHSRISNYETATSEPSIEDLEKIARTLKRPLEAFFKSGQDVDLDILKVPVFKMDEMIDKRKPLYYIPLERSSFPSKGAVAFLNEDSSMSPEFGHNAIVLLNTSMPPRINDYVLVSINNEVVFKKLVRDVGKAYLVSLNTYPPIPIPKDVIIIGVVAQQIIKTSYL